MAQHKHELQRFPRTDRVEDVWGFRRSQESNRLRRKAGNHAWRIAGKCVARPALRGNSYSSAGCLVRLRELGPAWSLVASGYATR